MSDLLKAGIDPQCSFTLITASLFLDAGGKPENLEETFMDMQNSTVTVTQAQDQTWISERAVLPKTISNSG